MGLYSEGRILGLEIKLRNTWDILDFLWCFTVFVAYPGYRFTLILQKFKPLPSKNSRCAPVR